MGQSRCANGASLLVPAARQHGRPLPLAAGGESPLHHHDDGAVNRPCSAVSLHPASSGCTSTRHPASPMFRLLDLGGSGALRRENPVHYVCRQRGRVASDPRIQPSMADHSAARDPGGDQSLLRVPALKPRRPRSKWTSTRSPDSAAQTSGVQPSGHPSRTRAAACSAPRRTWTAWRRRSSSTTSTCAMSHRTSSKPSHNGTRRTRRHRYPSSSITTLAGRRIRLSWTRSSSCSALEASTTRTRRICATSTHKPFLGRRTVLGRLRPLVPEARGYRLEAQDPPLALQVIAHHRLARLDAASPRRRAAADRPLVLPAYPVRLLGAVAAESLLAKLTNGSPRSERERTVRCTRPGGSRTVLSWLSSASVWSRRRMASLSRRCARSSCCKLCATRT